MNPWYETQYQALLAAKSETDVMAVLTRAARELGFDYCAYGIRLPFPLTRPKFHLLNNYPKEWQQRYADRQYMTIDPTVAHALRSVLPLVWSDTVFQSCPEFWEDVQAYGLRVGWGQACQNAKGTGLMTLARAHDDLSAAELQDNQAQMCWLANAAHEVLSPLVMKALAPETSTILSDRELEVLRWTAEGKTSGEIGDIMNITERTVNFHVNNAVMKLGASNKTAATIKAAMFGLL